MPGLLPCCHEHLRDAFPARIDVNGGGTVEDDDGDLVHRPGNTCQKQTPAALIAWTGTAVGPIPISTMAGTVTVNHQPLPPLSASLLTRLQLSQLLVTGHGMDLNRRGSDLATAHGLSGPA